MKVPWNLVLLISLAAVALVLFDWWSGRDDRWKAELRQAVATVRAEDSLAFAGTVARLREDSLAGAQAKAQADSAERRADQEAGRRMGIARELGAARVALAQATTIRDSVVLQGAVIARQDSLLASDSVEKAALRVTLQGRDRQLGIKDRTIAGLTNDLTDARARLAALIDKAVPPKRVSLFGFALSLKPYVGVGINLTPQGKATYGAQLGLSILRG